MITIDKKTVVIEFGKNGMGAVSLQSKNTSNYGGDDGNILTIRDLEEAVKIGENPEKDSPDLPKVVLTFYDEKSIDVVIENLKRIKQNLKFPQGSFALAC